MKSVEDQSSLFWNRFYCPLAKDLSTIELDEREVTGKIPVRLECCHSIFINCIGKDFVDYFSFDKERSLDTIPEFLTHGTLSLFPIRITFSFS
jgi:hypothetical protein